MSTNPIATEPLPEGHIREIIDCPQVAGIYDGLCIRLNHLVMLLGQSWRTDWNKRSCHPGNAK